MTFFNIEYDQNNFAAMCGDTDATILLNIWQSTSGILPDENDAMMHISPRILIAGKPKNDVELPPLMHCGEKSFAASVMGQSWASKLTLVNEAHSLKYHKTTSNGYRQVNGDRAPRYDVVGAIIHDYQMQYERLILPFKTKAGMPITLCLSMNGYVAHESDFGSVDRHPPSHNLQSANVAILDQPEHRQR